MPECLSLLCPPKFESIDVKKKKKTPKNTLMNATAA